MSVNTIVIDGVVIEAARVAPSGTIATVKVKNTEYFDNKAYECTFDVKGFKNTCDALKSLRVGQPITVVGKLSENVVESKNSPGKTFRFMAIIAQKISAEPWNPTANPVHPATPQSSEEPSW
jgi:hypothetical protein